MPRQLLTAAAVRTHVGLAGDAVLVDAGRILAVGTSDALRSEGVPERHFPGGTILPGLRDAHLHPVGYAAALQRPTLKQATDFSAIQDIVSDAVRRQTPGGAITALRLDDESLAERRLPDRHVIDAVSSDRPILLMRYCGHVAVANTAALVLAGIDSATPDPIGGVIDRDPLGHPTGVLRETAIEPVTAALRPLAPAITPDEVRAALTALAATGLTGVGAMAATDTGLWGGATSELEVLLEAAHESPIDLAVFVIAPTPDTLRRAAARIDAAGGRTRFGGVKMFSDGSLGGHTAAMHQGFSDARNELGTDRLDPAWARTMADTALDLGGRVAVHAIGDRANTNVLDLMERLIDGGTDPTRLRVEHASVLTQADIARFGALKITASVQPAFLASETEWLEKRVGTDRMQRTYPFRSLVEAGAALAGGSDSPVEPPHPLLGIATARDRMGMVPAESLEPAAALALFTVDAARACGVDGALQVGGRADFTIVDTDPVAAGSGEVRATRVLSTWVGGAEVPIPAQVVAWQG